MTKDVDMFESIREMLSYVDAEEDLHVVHE